MSSIFFGVDDNLRLADFSAAFKLISLSVSSGWFQRGAGTVPFQLRPHPRFQCSMTTASVIALCVECSASASADPVRNLCKTHAVSFLQRFGVSITLRICTFHMQQHRSDSQRPGPHVFLHQLCSAVHLSVSCATAHGSGAATASSCLHYQQHQPFSCICDFCSIIQQHITAALSPRPTSSSLPAATSALGNL
jgi:hypothetical protein